jgi:predicted NBD/HSP70 family sugar kinase
MKAEVSVIAGLSVASIVYAVYSNMTPNIADIRVAKPNDPDVDATRKAAAWTSAAIVSGISLIAKDGTIFVIGGAMVIAMDWFHRHADQVTPLTGRATAPDTVPVETQATDESAYGYEDAIPAY